MAEQVLHRYKSRRNRAELVRTDAGQVVIKTFSEEAAFQKERHIYNLLQETDLPCARLIAAENKTLVLSRLPGRNLVDCLEGQEQTGRPVWDIWEKLVEWLIAFQRQTGFLMTDVNLRNFLYDETTNVLYGVDFEECDVCDLAISAARLAAFIRTYKPENTLLKQEIAQYVLNLFARSCGLEVNALLRETERQETRILERRNKKQ